MLGAEYEEDEEWRKEVKISHGKKEEKEDKMFGKCCDEVVLGFSFKENGFECLLGWRWICVNWILNMYWNMWYVWICIY